MTDTVVSARQRLANTVLEGEDGYLFHRDHDALTQVTGENPFTPGELQIWRTAIETRSAWCRARGIAFRFLIIPEKHVIYADKLPKGVAVSPDRPAEQLMVELASEFGGEIFYPVAELTSARASRETYYKTDTHWTMWGAFLTYELLMRSLEGVLTAPTVTYEDLKFTARDFTGDLGVRLDPEPDERIEMIGHEPPRPVRTLFENKLFTRGSTNLYTSGIAGAPDCVMFRDSFANYVIPHMIPTFGRLLAVGSTSMHYDLVRSEKPQIVMFAMAERFLGYFDTDGSRFLPQDLTTPPYIEFGGVEPEVLRAMS